MGGVDDVKETEYSKEMAKIATEKWAISQQSLQPLEDMMIVDTKRGVTDTQRNQVSGAIGVNTQKKFAEATDSTLKSLAAGGVDPSSGKFTESLSNISRAGGESRAASEVEGEAGLQGNLVNKELNLLRIGSGDATEAQSSLSDVARRAASKANTEAQLQQQENAGLRQLAGTIGGAAAGYYGSKPTKAEFDAQHAAKFGVTD